MADRKLDGIYMRIERGGKWDNVCLSDMTTEERCNVLRSIGGELDIWVGEQDG